MNLPWILFGILLMLLNFQKISADLEEKRAIRHKVSGPLAVTVERQPPTFSLAIPRRYKDRKEVVSYFYDAKGENGPSQKFKPACPAITTEQKKMEKKWRKDNNYHKQSTLFFMKEYKDSRMECLVPKDTTPGPSIKKTNTECGNSQGKIHLVGYVVSNENGWYIQFLPIYEICYSDNKNGGMIYTKHRIDSPSLMLLKVYEKFKLRWSDTFESPVGMKLNKAASAYENKRIYQFVPKHDMPTILWQNTTLFPFNYIPLGPYYESDKILEGMMKYDNFVRLFSRQTNKPLTIYSGTYQLTYYKDDTNCFGRSCKTPAKLDSFWRVITDNKNKAAILITQYTRKPCKEETPMCYKDYRLLESYPEGGCTYICSLTTAVIEMLELPKLEIAETLNIAYTTKVKPKSNTTPEGTEGQSDADAQPSYTQVDISDFGGGLSFTAALLAVDAATAEIMQHEGAIESDNGGDADGGIDGGTDHGDGDTGGHAEGGEGAGGGGGGGGSGGIGGEGGG